MSLNRYAAKRDANESPIIAAAKQMGWHMVQMKEPFDWLGFLKTQSLWMPIEIKSAAGVLTPNQESFRLDCIQFRMPFLIWHSVEEMVQQTNKLREAK